MAKDMKTFTELIGTYLSPYLGVLLVITISVSLGLLALFILHTVTFWLSTDPEIAFHKARDYAGYASSGWNSFRTLYNGGKQIAFHWVPGWNTIAKHMIEPGIWIGLDVISQIFANQHYKGIIADVDNFDGESVPFRGHYCGNAIRNDDGSISGFEEKSETTIMYCAFESAELWAGKLNIAQSSDPTNIIFNNTLILSTAHARKLQAYFAESGIVSGEGDSMFPALNLGPLLEAIAEIAAVTSIVETTLYDIAAHVIYTILSELAQVMFNIVQIVIRAVAAVLMSLVSSGALQTIIKAGVDLLLTLVIYVAVPLLLAILDMIVCLINFMQPGTWPDQLTCIEQTCFLESGNIGTQHISLIPFPLPCAHLHQAGIPLPCGSFRGRDFHVALTTHKALEYLAFCMHDLLTLSSELFAQVQKSSQHSQACQSSPRPW